MKKINIFITGADHPTGLGTARALRKEDANIIGITSNPDSLCCHSKVWTEIIPISANSDYLEKMMEIGKSYSGFNMLLPSQDSIVQLISDEREILQKYFHFVLPEKASVNTLMDKTAFHKWAVQNEFPVPKSYVVETYSEFENVLDEFQFPFIIKPYVKTDLWDVLSPVDKVLKLKNRNSLDKINFDLFEASPKLIVQQWIPGRDSDVYFCLVYFDKNGKEVAHYTGRKIYQWPVDNGSTAAAVGVDNHEIHQITREVFKRAEFRGLGSVEFKQSDVDKKYYIIEPTIGRNDLQSYVSVAGGVNLTRIAFFDTINRYEKRIENRQKKGVWIAEEPLIDAIRLQRKKNDFRLNELFHLLTGKKSFSLFDIKDPRPFFDLVIKKMKRK